MSSTSTRTPSPSTSPPASNIETPVKNKRRRQSSSTSSATTLNRRTSSVSQSETTISETDEVKIFTAIKTENDPNDDDVDVDGIDDRLSPVVVEPTSPLKQASELLNGSLFANGGYGAPFFHPYFHPMFQSYFNAAAQAAQQAATSNGTSTTNSSSSKDNQIRSSPHLGMYGPSMPMPMPMGLHPGMAFPGQPSPFPPSLYPPGQQWRPNLFNPFGLPLPSIPPTPSSPRNNHQQVPSFDGSPRSLSRLLDQQKAPKKPHIKKPLNAFMLYMKEQRAKVIAECTLKESSAINKVLGQKWKQLARSEQDKYYEMAKEERLRHMQLYPGWSARDNYGIKKNGQTTVRHHRHRVTESNNEKKHRWKMVTVALTKNVERLSVWNDSLNGANIVDEKRNVRVLRKKIVSQLVVEAALIILVEKERNRALSLEKKRKKNLTTMVLVEMVAVTTVTKKIE